MIDSNTLKVFFSDVKLTISKAKYFVLIAAIIYCSGLVVGLTSPDSFSFFEQIMGELTNEFADRNAADFILKIFAHNLIATYVVICMGVLFGIVPVCAAAFNGLITGWVIAKVSGMSFFEIAIMLFPHGIFEYPAMMLAWGLGIWMGFGYRFSDSQSTRSERWQKATKVFIAVILPLLCIAAIIEGRYHILKEYF